MTHEEYITLVRDRAATVASGILDGSIGLLEGVRQLASFRFEIELDESDPDFLAIVSILDQIDHLPVGDVRKLWAPSALERLEPQTRSAVEWATPLALPACQSIVQRFGR